jgi:hypothetical protein
MKVSYANGDVYSASDVNDTNGTINLLTSSTLSSQAGKNSIINGGMDIWQRGTSVAGTTTVLLADRWNAYRAVAGSTFSRQASGLTGFNYGLRMQRDSGNSATNLLQTLQNYETVNTIPLAGQTVTLSWYAKVGANFSATSSQMFVQVYTGTGTDQNILNGYTGSTTLLNNTVTITTSYVRYSKTFTIGSTMTEMSIVFGFNPTGTASTNDWLEITGVQLELGSTPTTFSRAGGGGIQGELAACQRYYQKSYGQAVTVPTNATASGLAMGVTTGTTATGAYLGYVKLPVTMRISPTITIYSYTSSTSGVVSDSGGTDKTANSGVAVNIGDSSYQVFNSSGGTLAIPAGNGFVWHYKAEAEL